jgi:ribonuclease Y
MNELIRIIGEIVLIAGLTAIVSYALIKPKLNAAIAARQDAEDVAASIREDAEREREKILLQAREEAIRVQRAADEEVREKRAALDRLDLRLQDRDDALERRRLTYEEREREIAERLIALSADREELQRRSEEIDLELERLAGLDRAAARELYLARLKPEFEEAARRLAKETEMRSMAEAEQRARALLIDVLERCAVDYLTEATVAVVNLPSEDMKGRIIGRDGRNIRAFEQVAGVDLIVDDTPEAVVISCFDPLRREKARLALMNLMVDGRIHPGRIEELYEKAQTEVDRTVREAGERAAEHAGVSGLNPQVIETMGKLRFRTSYAQNVLDHSVEVARLAAMLAADLRLNVEVAKRAGFLHDIGKALGPDWEGPHALTGMEFLRQTGVHEPILNAVGAHHRDIDPASPEAQIVILADQISAARPGARRESLENYVKRLSALETIAQGFPGVERSFALQAGREVRLIVCPDQVDDVSASRLASEVARRIEQELEYPGTIRVTVIRETRVHETAK